jgi:hypothetical protein
MYPQICVLHHSAIALSARSRPMHRSARCLNMKKRRASPVKNEIETERHSTRRSPPPPPAPRPAPPPDESALTKPVLVLVTGVVRVCACAGVCVCVCVFCVCVDQIISIQYPATRGQGRCVIAGTWALGLERKRETPCVGLCFLEPSQKPKPKAPPAGDKYSG